jgi:hypothetical protein
VLERSAIINKVFTVKADTADDKNLKKFEHRYAPIDETVNL